MLFAAAGILSLNHMLIYTPDSARYLAWANSLAQFRGYIDLTVPEPARYVVHAPLYPALLVPAAWIAPTSILAAKIATLLFGTLTLAVFFLWMKTNVEWRLALGAAIALSLNSFMLIYSTQVLSEVPFFLCIVIAFWLTQDVIEKANRPPMVGWREIGLVAAVVAAIFLREVGLTLVMAMLVVLVLHKRYRTAGILFGISVLFSMAWFVRNEIVIATAEQPAMRNTHLFFSHLYTANNASLVQEFLARLSTNAAIYSEAALRLLFLPEFGLRSYMLVRPQEGMLSIALSILSIMRYPIIVCSVGGMMYGAWCARKRPATAKILLVFTSVYVVPILLYPINDNRFLFPLLSVFLAVVSFAIEDLLARFKFGEGKNKIRFALATVLGLLVVFPNAAWSVSFVENGWRYHHHPVEYISDIQC
ncbi:MAG: glycosyltransferase family 39 protein, partial [Ignavibacteriales bacterium]|nr:glycosyltransferase family 39 protein [Ignavibacteriales bacterium]